MQRLPTPAQPPQRFPAPFALIAVALHLPQHRTRGPRVPRERIELRPQRSQHRPPLSAALRLFRQGADGVRRQIPLALATSAGTAEDFAPSPQIAPPTPAAGAECRQGRTTGMVIVTTQGSEEFAYAI